MVKKLPVLPLFLIIEVVLYAAFLYCDVIGSFGCSTILKYISLLLCFAFSVDNHSAKDGGFVCLALGLTAIADFFLLVLNRWYEIGVAVFCLVQLIYALRLREMNEKAIPFWIRIIVGFGTLAGVILSGLFNILNLLVCIYFPQLCCNAIASLLQPDTGGKRLFAIGLWLFVCCDICVGINNMPISNQFLQTFVSVAMWAFYLPSQILIVLSASRRLPMNG